MADITDLAQKLAFYQNGGQDPGTSGLDKFNSGLGIVDSTIKDVLAIKKAKYDRAKSGAETAKLTGEANKLGIENTPQSAYMTPGGLDTTKLTAGQQDILSQKGLRDAQAAALNRKPEKTGVIRVFNKITGQKIAEYPASEGNGDSNLMVGEDTLPSYKKSELLQMSPETRAVLGKYKVIDDTSPNKNTDDNQTIDSILSGIDRLSRIRNTMGGMERGATIVPGGSAVGKNISGPLSSWETEKNLLAQRLGKLVEKNRMSDEDRKFYLKQFNSPAATDVAFNANISGLKTALGEMKKALPGANNGQAADENNDPLGIR